MPLRTSQRGQKASTKAKESIEQEKEKIQKREARKQQEKRATETRKSKKNATKSSSVIVMPSLSSITKQQANTKQATKPSATDTDSDSSHNSDTISPPPKKKSKPADFSKSQPTSYSFETVAKANPTLILQLNLHNGNRTRPKFCSDNTILTNKERAESNSQHPKAFPTDLHFNDNDFLGKTIPAIEECIQSTLPGLELHDFNHGAVVYYREKGLSHKFFSQYDPEIMDDSNPRPICDNDDWRKAIKTAVLELNGDGKIVHMWLNLLCHVRPKKVKPNKQKRVPQQQSLTSSCTI